MIRQIVKTIALIVLTVVIVSLVRFYWQVSDIYIHTHERCNTPILITVQVDETEASKSEEFTDMVDLAINKWDKATHKNLFERVSPDNLMSRSGLLNTINFTPQNKTQFTALNDPNVAGKTLTYLDNAGMVSSFKVEIYDEDEHTLVQTIMHELGHAHGVLHHTHDQNDIMYPAQVIHNDVLTQNDINAIMNYCNGN